MTVSQAVTLDRYRPHLARPCFSLSLSPPPFHPPNCRRPSVPKASQIAESRQSARIICSSRGETPKEARTQPSQQPSGASPHLNKGPHSWNSYYYFTNYYQNQNCNQNCNQDCNHDYCELVGCNYSSIGNSGGNSEQ